jgi:hypothetical protein
VLLDASLPQSVTWTGTLAGLHDATLGGGPGAAGTIVIGAVVGLRALTAKSDAPSAAEADAEDSRGSYGGY